MIAQCLACGAPLPARALGEPSFLNVCDRFFPGKTCSRLVTLDARQHEEIQRRRQADMPKAPAPAAPLVKPGLVVAPPPARDAGGKFRRAR